MIILGLYHKLIAPNGDLTIPIYRTRIIDETKFDLADIHSFSYPPLGSCKKGRCNLEGFPVFYASLSADTALREMRKPNDQILEKGDEVYISEWKVKEGVIFRFSQFIFSDEVPLGEWLKDLNQTNIEKLKQISQPYNQNKQEAFKFLNNKLSKYFVSDNYNISSFLSHYILYDDRNFPLAADGIMYPSIQAGLNNINFAIHPDFVQANLQLVKVQKVSFIQFEDNGARMSLINLGIPNNQNKIEWFTPQFDTNNMKITGIEVMFDIDPSVPNLSTENDFFKNNERVSLFEIAWERINNNMKQVLNILSDLGNDYKFDYLYQKEFFVHIKKNSIYLKVNNQRFFIEILKICMDYKVTLNRCF